MELGVEIKSVHVMRKAGAWLPKELSRHARQRAVRNFLRDR
jgi:hypothetical protein